MPMVAVEKRIWRSPGPNTERMRPLRTRMKSAAPRPNSTLLAPRCRKACRSMT
jgi:hypothetical protein